MDVFSSLLLTKFSFQDLYDFLRNLIDENTKLLIPQQMFRVTKSNYIHKNCMKKHDFFIVDHKNFIHKDSTNSFEETWGCLVYDVICCSSVKKGPNAQPKTRQTIPSQNTQAFFSSTDVKPKAITLIVILCLFGQPVLQPVAIILVKEDLQIEHSLPVPNDMAH